jgi:GNAT superfamily N-acetyltransferase
VARGFGLGARLIGECLNFAHQVGYRQVVLSTYSVLEAARHLYRKAGFRLAAAGSCHSYGHHLTEEHWTLDLA